MSTIILIDGMILIYGLLFGYVNYFAGFLINGIILPVIDKNKVTKHKELLKIFTVIFVHSFIIVIYILLPGFIIRFLPFTNVESRVVYAIIFCIGMAISIKSNLAERLLKKNVKRTGK